MLIFGTIFSNALVSFSQIGDTCLIYLFCYQDYIPTYCVQKITMICIIFENKSLQDQLNQKILTI